MKTQLIWKKLNTLKTLLSVMFISSMLMSCASLTVSQAIADANDPALIKEFEKEILVIAKAASEDPNYKRIPLDSEEDQTWFTSLAFLLWDNKTTSEAFVKEGLTRFPDYKESFEYIVKKVEAIQ